MQWFGKSDEIPYNTMPKDKRMMHYTQHVAEPFQTGKKYLPDVKSGRVHTALETKLNEQVKPHRVKLAYSAIRNLTSSTKVSNNNNPDKLDIALFDWDAIFANVNRTTLLADDVHWIALSQCCHCKHFAERLSSRTIK